MIRRLLPILLVTVAFAVAGACDTKKAAETPAATPAATATPAAGDKAATPAPGTTAADPAAKVDVKAAHAGAAKGADGAQVERIEGWVAKVNDVPVDSNEFYTELDKITARGAKIPPDRLSRIQQNILKRLIEKELVRQAVDKAGVKVNEVEVEAAFTEYKKRFQTEEQFDNYLKHGRVTLESIKARIRDKKALEKLIESKGNLGVSDDEGKEFYAKNERFYIEKAGVRASHVLVKLPEKATGEQEKAAMAKVKDVQKRIKAGDDFAELAKKFSEGPSAPKGGDLGFFGNGQMVKEFEEAAFAMKVGDISGPVRTRFGFHIIKVVDKREERKKSFDEVKEQIEQSLRNKKFFQERRKLLEDLQKDAKIDKRLPEVKGAGAATDGHGKPAAVKPAAIKPASAPTVAPKPAPAARPAAVPAGK